MVMKVSRWAEDAAGRLVDARTPPFGAMPLPVAMPVIDLAMSVCCWS